LIVHAFTEGCEARETEGASTAIEMAHRRMPIFTPTLLRNAFMTVGGKTRSALIRKFTHSAFVGITIVGVTALSEYRRGCANGQIETIFI
jgi:hypothetical protein